MVYSRLLIALSERHAEQAFVSRQVFPFWRCEMRKKLALSFGLLAAFLTVDGPLWAHHGGSEYDTKNLRTLRGTVTEYYWANPHCQIFLDVKDDSGKTVLPDGKDLTGGERGERPPQP